MKPKLDSFARHSLKSVEEMLKIGENTAKERLDEIKELLRMPEKIASGA